MDQPTDISTQPSMKFISRSMPNPTPYQHFAPSQVSDVSTPSVRDLREIMLAWGSGQLANQAYGSSVTLTTYNSSTLDPSMESLLNSQARDRECQLLRMIYNAS